MPSLLDIGKSAIDAQRQALGVTGQNIANVNTDGYRKRDASIVEVSGQQSEIASKVAQLGLGVSFSEVRRSFNAFLAQSADRSESMFHAASSFVDTVKNLENLVLPTEGDLASELTEFFARLSDVAANPGDLAPRAALIERANGLSNSFNVTAQVIGDFKRNLRLAIDDEINSVNRLTENLANVNQKLRASNLGAAPPNALLDERDRLVTAISEKVMITTEYGSRSDVTMTFGRHTGGPKLVEGDNSDPINVLHSDISGTVFNVGSGLQFQEKADGTIAINTGAISSGLAFKHFDGGGLKGLTTGLEIIETTIENLDLLAIRFIEGMNASHVAGVDYNGERGKEIFSAKEFEILQPKSNTKGLEISFLPIPGKIDNMSDMFVTYDHATDYWIAKNGSGDALGKGRTSIDLNGMVIRVSGSARDGDNFRVARVSGEAERLHFLLKDGKEIAAASDFVTIPSSKNTGSAVVTTKTAVDKSANLNDITSLTTNSLSSVSYTEFRKGGAIGLIPANVENIELSSFGQSPTIQFNFSEDIGLSSFSFISNGTQHSFPSTNTKDILTPVGDLGERYNLSADTIAEYLNNGVIRSASGASLRDLGLFAAGSDAGLKIAGPSSFTSGTITTQAGSTTPATVQDGVDASSFSVFTREGRQIAGQPIDVSEANLLVTTENGFRAGAQYRADYLSTLGGIGYLGAEVTKVKPGGSAIIDDVNRILTDNKNSELIQQEPSLNQIKAQNLNITTSDGLVEETVIVVEATSTKDIAKSLNERLQRFGFDAKAKTIASMELSETSSANGSLGFGILAEDGKFISISSEYSDKNLSAVVEQINVFTEETGIRAELTANAKRLVLVDDDGDDIVLDNFNGALLEANVLDHSFKKLIDSEVNLDKRTKFIGSLNVLSTREFNISSDNGQSSKSSNSDLLSGGLKRIFERGGSVTNFEWTVPNEQLPAQASPNGLRVAAPGVTFSLKAEMNGTTGPDVNLNLKSAELNTFTSNEISKKLVDSARALAAVPSVEGSVIGNLPPEGSSMSVKVGGSIYEINFIDGKLSVTGPEEGRVLATLETLAVGYKVSLAVPDGVMSGRSIEVLDNTDAAKFGLASNDPFSETILRGRPFAFQDEGAVAVTTGLTNGKKYLIGSKGTTDFTNADSGNTLGSAVTGTIFTSDGSALTGSATVNQVFTSNGGTKAAGGDVDFLNIIDVHSLSDLVSNDVGSSWIVADNSSNAGLTVGSVHTLTQNGSNYQLNGQTLAAGIKLIKSNQKFEVVDNGTASHANGTLITLNMNSSGVLTDENGVTIGSSLGLIKGTVKSFDVDVGSGATTVTATVTVTNHRGRYTLHSSDNKLNFVGINANSGVATSAVPSGIGGAGGLVAKATDLANFGVANSIVQSATSGAAGVVATVSGNVFRVSSPVTSSGNVDVAVDGKIFTISLTKATTPGIIETGSQFATLLASNSDFNQRYRVTDGGDGTVTITPRPEKSIITVTSAFTSSGKVDVAIDGTTYAISLTKTGTPTVAETGSQIANLLAANVDFNQNYSVSDSGTGVIKITPRDKTLSVPTVTIDSLSNTPVIGLVASQSNGPISIIPSTDSKDLGFQAGAFDFELTKDGLSAISTNSERPVIELDLDGLKEQTVSISNLPPEDLIVVLNSDGARRVGAKYTTIDNSVIEDEAKSYRLQMTDQNTGKIELLDSRTGHSIATRFSAGAADFFVDGRNMIVSGFADQDDFFDVRLNESSAGDAGNVEAMIELSQRTSDRPSFQDDFRSIALAVGSQLVSGKMAEQAASAMRDAAVAAQDELTGVNLDEEASKLLEQQQAYKAAAQILQTARDMFDTLVAIM